MAGLLNMGNSVITPSSKIFLDFPLPLQRSRSCPEQTFETRHTVNSYDQNSPSQTVLSTPGWWCASKGIVCSQQMILHTVWFSILCFQSHGPRCLSGISDCDKPDWMCVVQKPKEKLWETERTNLGDRIESNASDTSTQRGGSSRAGQPCM